MLHCFGTSIIHAAAVVPVGLLVLFTGRLWLLVRAAMRQGPT